MKKLLIIALISLFIVAGCAKQPSTLDSQEAVETPLDDSLQGSDTLEEDLNADELDGVDEDLNSLDQDLQNI